MRYNGYMKIFYPVLFVFLSVFVSLPALAQNMENGVSAARLQRIERDLMLLQRQLARPGAKTIRAAGSTKTVAGADFEIRLSAIEEQIRKLLGKIEENDFKLRKISKNLEKMQRDAEFRFSELEGSHSATKPVSKSLTLPVGDGSDNSLSERKVPGGNLNTVVNRNSFRSVDNENASDVETNFSNPREHYNYAFRLLNQAQYAKSATVFENFIEEHPRDALIGNAYYWLGETFYIRHDYVKAADSFRQGFEVLPGGPKAPDNLLKLAMTLNALKHKKDACVVLGKVVSKFSSKSAAVSQKARQEQKRIDCRT